MENTKLCQILLQAFAKKSKAILKSVTELAVDPIYFYKYSSISDAIDAIFKYDLEDVELDKKS